MSSLHTSYQSYEAKERTKKPMLVEWILKISDYGDAAVSKAIHHFGVYVGIGGGTATYAASQVVDKTDVNEWAAFALEYGGIVTLIAGVVLALKNLSDVILSWTKAYWERKDKLNEQSPPD